MLTADTITDEQIRELLELRAINRIQFHKATNDIVGWVDTAYQDERRAARARCAEIYNCKIRTADWIKK
jgi:hypothetical protein